MRHGRPSVEWSLYVYRRHQSGPSGTTTVVPTCDYHPRWVGTRKPRHTSHDATLARFVHSIPSFAGQSFGVKCGTMARTRKWERERTVQHARTTHRHTRRRQLVSL